MIRFASLIFATSILASVTSFAAGASSESLALQPFCHQSSPPETREEIITAIGCATQLFWQTNFDEEAAQRKYLLHRAICLDNPASHFAMRAGQRDFYCNLSLHFRMCNTQGLYALRPIIDSPARRERENEIFAACLSLSNEIEYFAQALHSASLEEAAVNMQAYYNQYKVELGVRVAPISVNPVRRAFWPLEKVVRTLFYSVAIPIEQLESLFSNKWHRLTPAERMSELKEIVRFNKALKNWNGKDLLDVSDLL